MSGIENFNITNTRGIADTLFIEVSLTACVIFSKFPLVTGRHVAQFYIVYLVKLPAVYIALTDVTAVHCPRSIATKQF